MQDSQSRPKIVVADDIEMVIKLEEILLRRTGCDVLKAKDGTEALKLIQQEKPAVALLDLIMPKMNGDVVCKSVKDSSELKDITVIMVTAKGEKEDEERSKKAGVIIF